MKPTLNKPSDPHLCPSLAEKAEHGLSECQEAFCEHALAEPCGRENSAPVWPGNPPAGDFGQATVSLWNSVQHCCK